MVSERIYGFLSYSTELSRPLPPPLHPTRAFLFYVTQTELTTVCVLALFNTILKETAIPWFDYWMDNERPRALHQSLCGYLLEWDPRNWCLQKTLSIQIISICVTWCFIRFFPFLREHRESLITVVLFEQETFSVCTVKSDRFSSLWQRKNRHKSPQSAHNLRKLTCRVCKPRRIKQSNERVSLKITWCALAFLLAAQSGSYW